MRRIVLAALLCLVACEEQPETQPTPKPERPATTAPTPAATRTAKPVDLPKEPKAIPAPDDVAEPPKDAKKTASGLYTKVLDKGAGKKRPKPSDRVKVHYTGWTKDGRMFDSSVARGEPAKFSVDGVIKGWTEALQLMVQGEKRRLWIPGELAYGETAPPGMPAGQLTFDVELVEILEPVKAPPVPKDVKAPPADAKKTESGLAYKLLEKGKGDKNPSPMDRVTVHYTGWTPDGKQFDSSIVRDEPTTFPLSRVVKGWTEGVQLMKVGDKMRFWIPSHLAYGDKPAKPGAPAGPLVFDIELLAIQ